MPVCGGSDLTIMSVILNNTFNGLSCSILRLLKYLRLVHIMYKKLELKCTATVELS